MSVVNTLARSTSFKALTCFGTSSVSISKSNNSSFNFSLVVLSVFTLKTTSACWFKAVASLDHIFSPNSFSANASIQSGKDSLIFLVLDNSSKRPLIFLVGVFSKYFQSGSVIPFKVAQTANIRQISSLLNGSFTSAISA